MRNCNVTFRLFIVVVLIQSFHFVYASAPVRQYYTLSIYHFKDTPQEKALYDYFSDALLPGLHRMKIVSFSVFKSLASNKASLKQFYDLFHFISAGDLQPL